MARDLPKLDYDPHEYAIIVFHWPDTPGKPRDWQIAADPQGRVIVFDNKQIAQDWMPLLSNDRLTIWDDLAYESCHFEPLDPNCFNRGMILHPYPIYNLPPGHPVPSETRLRGWKWHVMYSQWVRELEEANPRKSYKDQIIDALLRAPIEQR